MSIHSDIHIDYNYILSHQLNSDAGISIKEFEKILPTVTKIQEGLVHLRQLGQIPFQDLPFHREQLDLIKEKGQEVFERFDDVVVLGIGGSGLGPACLYDALKPPFEKLKTKDQRKSPRLFVMDNVDPVVWEDLLTIVDLKKTFFIIISKSGQTIETLGALAFFRNKLIQKLGVTKYKHHLALITDPHEGPLRRIAEKEDIMSFAVPPGVGGRFSVLTPVGLFPAACMGFEIEQLLNGAQRMDERSKTTDIWANPPYLSGALHFLLVTKKNKTLRILMPYTEQLETYSEWFCQLWAESLGKQNTLKGTQIHAGQTPVRAMGATDQHSQLQLYLEGPKDKVVTFYTVQQNSKKTFPASYSNIEECQLLAGKPANVLLDIEYKATEQALRKAGVPSMTIHIPRLDENTLGQLFYFAELETVVTGKLYNINPFDQPAVESIKKYIKGLLGIKSFAKYKKELQDSKKDKQYII